MNLTSDLNLNIQGKLSSIRGGRFGLVFFLSFLLRGIIRVITFDFTVRSMVRRSVADGKLCLHGSFLQWALTK